MKIDQDVTDSFLEIVPAVLYEYVLYDEGSDNEFLALTPTSKDILGHPPEYFLEDMNRFWAMINPEDVERLQEEDRDANTEGVFFRSEVRFKLPNDKEIWIQIASKPTNKKVKNCTVWSGYIIDITEKKELEEQLKKRANLDSLTNVLNRRAFLERFQEEIKRARRYNNPLCLLLCDIDHFKSVNDKHGHLAGDDVLKQFVSFAEKSIRESDFVGRIGGEEFAIVLPQSNINEAMQTAERFREKVENTPISVEGKELKLTVSIGVISISPDVYEIEDILRYADIALYKAKDKGRNKVVVSTQ